MTKLRGTDAAWTKAGRELAARFDLGHQYTDTVGVFSLIVRHAKRLDRLAVEECNGPWWMDRENARIQRAFASGALEDHAHLIARNRLRMRLWEEDRDAREAATYARISELVAELSAITGDTWNVELGGDPRYYVVKLTPPPGVIFRSNTRNDDGFDAVGVA